MGRFNDVRRFDEIDSTNRWVAEQARGGAADGLVAVAGMQSAGRGRLDRTWIAPTGSALLCTVLVRPQMPITRWHWLNLAMAVAAQDAVRLLGETFADSGTKAAAPSAEESNGDMVDGGALGVSPLGVSPLGVERGIGASAVAVKWPNDLIVPSRGDRKLAGILAEMVLPAKGEGAVAVGIGLNVRRPAEVDPDVAARGVWLDELFSAPTELLSARTKVLSTPTNLLSAPTNLLSAPTNDPKRSNSESTNIGLSNAEKAYGPTVEEVLSVLLSEFERQVTKVEDHPDVFLEQYRQRCITVGREVRAMLPNSEIVGTATGIDFDGQLLVTAADGTIHHINAADVVHIRPASESHNLT